MRTIILILIICINIPCFCQQSDSSIVGKYIKSNEIYPRLFEYIILKNSNMFEYSYRGEFLEFKVAGTWSLDNGYLLLNSNDSNKSTMNVEEFFDSKLGKDKFKIKVSNKGYPISCVVVLNKGDYKSEKEIRNFFDVIVLPSKSEIKSVTIYSSVKHPTYLLKDCKTNFLKINIDPNRIFKNEKWLYIENKLIPIGIDGEYANYTLSKSQ